MTTPEIPIASVLLRKGWRPIPYKGWRHRALAFLWPAADAFRLETEADRGDFQARRLLGRAKGRKVKA